MKIGVLGGGQLARMLALAGYPLGIELICIDPQIDSCAQKVTQVIHADFFDIDKINKHFSNVDCVTIETENLPIDAVTPIAKKYPLLPNFEALKITQDRWYEKNLFTELNIPTVNYAKVTSWQELQLFLEKFGLPAVLKTRRSGYDGKGQAILRSLEDAQKAWESMQAHELIVEQFVAYQFEVSQISVRSKSGEVAFYPLVHNEHRNGILHVSDAPYVNEELKILAQKHALAILKKFSYVGVMTIEFFCVNGILLANEIAPRVHNSGHWTIEGAQTSQFENHLRAILGLPLGSTDAIGFSAMINLISNKPDMRDLLAIPGLHFHWYDKLPKPNRKLGHITLCAEHQDQLTILRSKALDLMA